ncbi:MAG: ROK family protein [Lachnospiraceae bacterium]|nr:ROK family protein [Lachnospiraceae bacterium]
METYQNNYIRNLNSRLLLEHLIRLGPISRAALARQTGLTKATVSAIVAELISAGFAAELGSGDAELGRKPILLGFCRRAGFAVSIDLGPDYIRALAADLLGDVLLFKQQLTPGTSELIAVLAGLIASMQTAVSAMLPEQAHGLCGIALGIHGVVYDSQITFAPHYRIEQLPLAAELGQRFRVPVFAENEANLAVVGEASFLPPGCRSIVDVSIHSGVGLGLLLDGSLFTGSSGRAGEFGHTILMPGGRPCACGRQGCLEQYLSEKTLTADYAALTGRPGADYAQLANGIRAQEKEAADAVGTYLFYLSLCINNLVQAYDPELIFISDRLLSDFPELLPDLLAQCGHVPASRLRLSALGRNASLYGGIHRCVREFLGIRTLAFSGPPEIPF